jgi:hypothetical protein
LLLIDSHTASQASPFRACKVCFDDAERYEKLVQKVRELKEKKEWKAMLGLLEEAQWSFRTAFHESLSCKRVEVAIK